MHAPQRGKPIGVERFESQDRLHGSKPDDLIASSTQLEPPRLPQVFPLEIECAVDVTIDVDYIPIVFELPRLRWLDADAPSLIQAEISNRFKHHENAHS